MNNCDFAIQDLRVDMAIVVFVLVWSVFLVVMELRRLGGRISELEKIHPRGTGQAQKIAT